MGFLDKLVKTIASTAKNSITGKIEENWKSMENVRESRLEEIYNDGGPLAYLALLKLASKKGRKPDVANGDDSDMIERKVSSFKRMIDLSEGRSFDEIREAIKYFN